MIFYKSKQEIEAMRKPGEVIAVLFSKLEESIEPGITTYEINRISEEIIRSYKAVPSFLNYGKPPFPASVCVSVNNEVVHGIPSKKRTLNEGDIVSIDAGAYLNGFHCDAARTFPVGKINDEAKKLIEVTEQCFRKGVEKLAVGKRIGDVSAAIQDYAQTFGYGIIRELTGHGIGRNLHEDPDVPNFTTKGTGIRIAEGLVVAIEPMLNIGGENIKVQNDEWTIVTADGSLSSHYENTVAVSGKGHIILTEF